MAAARKANKVSVTDHELELLEAVNQLGPCSSEKLKDHLHPRFELLYVMRSLHALAEKGFLQRIVINHKQLYRTARNFSFIKAYIDNSNS
jgi:Fe2+ or Zn2+ uptake regulation protein